jgi:hypothetical protein
MIPCVPPAEHTPEPIGVRELVTWTKSGDHGWVPSLVPTTTGSEEHPGCARGSYRRALGGLLPRSSAASNLLGATVRKGFFANARELLPVDLAIQAHPDPATSSYIGWFEEPLWFADRKLALSPRRRGAP